MYTISWFYLYGAGGLLYGLGTYVVYKAGVLDFSAQRERRIYLLSTLFLAGFAGVHALFQFVLPFVD